MDAVALRQGVDAVDEDQGLVREDALHGVVGHVHLREVGAQVEDEGVLDDLALSDAVEHVLLALLAHLDAALELAEFGAVDLPVGDVAAGDLAGDLDAGPGLPWLLFLLLALHVPDQGLHGLHLQLGALPAGDVAPEPWELVVQRVVGDPGGQVEAAAHGVQVFRQLEGEGGLPRPRRTLHDEGVASGPAEELENLLRNASLGSHSTRSASRNDGAYKIVCRIAIALDNDSGGA